MECDTWVYRTYEEWGYHTKLDAFLKAGGAKDFSTTEVYNDALLYAVPLLPAEFRYVSRRDPDYVGQSHLKLLRFERTMRGRFKAFVPYQCVEVDCFTREAILQRYVPLPPWWVDVEVPPNFSVELPWMLTYIGSLLFTANQQAWAIFHTEWAAQVAAVWLWELYDTFRMFWLPPTVKANIRRLRLNFVLGSQINEDELRHFLDHSDQVAWESVDSSLRTRTVPVASNRTATLREDTGGDFIWFDPWERREMTRQEKELKVRPSMPERHYRGYVYVSNPLVDRLPTPEEERAPPPAATDSNPPSEVPTVSAAPSAPNVPPPPTAGESSVATGDKGPADMEVDIRGGHEDPFVTPAGSSAAHTARQSAHVGPLSSTSPSPPKTPIPTLGLCPTPQPVGNLDLTQGLRGASLVQSEVGTPGIPGSPTPSSVVRQALTGLAVRSTDDGSQMQDIPHKVDNDPSRVQFLQAFLRASGVDDDFSTVEEAMEAVKSLKRAQSAVASSPSKARRISADRGRQADSAAAGPSTAVREEVPTEEDAERAQQARGKAPKRAVGPDPDLGHYEEEGGDK